MATIYFVDACPPVPYDASLIQHAATGGTTADVILLAEALARDHVVAVLQDLPPGQATGKALYTSTSIAPKLPAPDLVVYVRGAWHMQEGHLSPAAIRQRNQDCRFVYTPHVTIPQPFAGVWSVLGRQQANRNRALYAVLREQQIAVVGVSQWHATNMQQHWPGLKVGWIYNPVAQPAIPAVDTDPYKLLYASSPERGLVRAIRVLNRLRRFEPRYHLYVASPGYAEAKPLLRAIQAFSSRHVVHLGHLDRPALFGHMRSAFCLLQPNLVFQETFGRVFAEAHMLGTPVLAHPAAAIPETVGDPGQLVDCSRISNVVDRIQQWQQNGRPVVKGRTVFLPESVAALWEDLMVSDNPVAFKIQRGDRRP